MFSKFKKKYLQTQNSKQCRINQAATKVPNATDASIFKGTALNTFTLPGE